MIKTRRRYIISSVAGTLGVLFGVGTPAQADSTGQLNLTPTDRGLLRFVERHSIGTGHREFRRFGHGPYYYPYAYRPYPYTGGPEYGAINPAGRLIVTAHPADAAVLVDGRLLARGADDTYQIGLLVGQHRVEVRAAGFAAYRQDVDIRVGNHHRLNVVLEPQ